MTDDYLNINKDIWNNDAANWVTFAQERWALDVPEWGNWSKPESELSMLPKDMAGLKAIELGCGTGYVSYWMVNRGATVTAIDLSKEQLSTARRLDEKHKANITFIEGNAEDTGLPDQSFDFAISEYGASIWCRPKAWLTEAYRLLRAGGRLVFLGNHPLSLIASPLNGLPAERVLHRPYRNMWGADWTKVEFEPTGVCFNLTMSGWMDLFQEIGFEVEKYHEIYAPDWAQDTRGAIPADWAKDYPVEQVWKLRKPE
ncbi:class I SAM-dependent methyltransferase [Cognatishimia maritima]|uniref:Ubiquinone/menaquinone biosynthesis C-methylase UbiE n=1 Tax=Cognatishimia maritima TaxID=870908 RepID=A0A1M5VJ15_9RHOB|nr:class I SAM-dependent methyltransferase [Cognatishimia maritima]SHH75221.1 Ubiquinone/menaquinone biosynthesis C-methylase UbiE [Cognatishimia maritima]